MRGRVFAGCLTRSLIFFVPRESTRKVLDHLFRKYSEEIGKGGNYEQCAFISRGTGQFKPISGAKPSIGKIGQLEFVEEDKVEVLVNDKGEKEELGRAIEELKKIHPYEEVAYEVYRLEDI
ncbi:hypothetical protein AX17_007121 [Amanita inopinata Kibby_2008]|nr:hypothetical protein AX17_007121 [Amanita inopinata Kibby_2008]